MTAYNTPWQSLVVFLCAQDRLMASSDVVLHTHALLEPKWPGMYVS